VQSLIVGRERAANGVERQCAEPLRRIDDAERRVHEVEPRIDVAGRRVGEAERWAREPERLGHEAQRAIDEPQRRPNEAHWVLQVVAAACRRSRARAPTHGLGSSMKLSESRSSFIHASMSFIRSSIPRYRTLDELHPHTIEAHR
jgi:hypothetical protein